MAKKRASKSDAKVPANHDGNQSGGRDESPRTASGIRRSAAPRQDSERAGRFLDTINLVPSRGRTRSFTSSSNLESVVEDGAVANVAEATMVFRRPDQLTPRDWAVYLLRRAAQIEHALLVQYLFAGYSLKKNVTLPGGLNTNRWRPKLIQIAREEMGHLLIVQNLLRLIGGTLCFEREEFPAATDLYPFPFQLERLSRDSLSKYVFTEMSAGPLPVEVITPELRTEIETRARQAAGVPGGSFINHVGTLYETLIDVFENDLQEGPEGDFRVDRGDWFGTSSQFPMTNDAVVSPGGAPDLDGVKALVATNKSEALVALRIVAQQGEAGDSTNGTDDSHFERFKQMYLEFPEDNVAATWPTVSNPNTRVSGADASTIPEGPTRLWATLFNIRYRILLTSLAHSLAMPAVSGGSPTRREDLIGWVYEEMIGGPGSLRDLAPQLLKSPLSDGAEEHAGPPFELPYSLTLPDLAPERWRLHLDLVTSSQRTIQSLRDAGQDSPILDELDARDASRRALIATFSTGPF